MWGESAVAATSGTTDPSLAAYADPYAGRGFPPAAFAALYSRPLPENVPGRRGAFTLNTPLVDMDGSAFAHLLLGATRRFGHWHLRNADPLLPVLLDAMLEQLSLRTLTLATAGAVREPTLEAVLHVTNGHYLRAARQLAAALSGRLAGLRPPHRLRRPHRPRPGR